MERKIKISTTLTDSDTGLPADNFDGGPKYFSNMDKSGQTRYEQGSG